MHLTYSCSGPSPLKENQSPVKPVKEHQSPVKPVNKQLSLFRVTELPPPTDKQPRALQFRGFVFVYPKINSLSSRKTRRVNKKKWKLRTGTVVEVMSDAFACSFLTV